MSDCMRVNMTEFADRLDESVIAREGSRITPGILEG